MSFSPFERLGVGPTPCEERCEPISGDSTLARAECAVFTRQLERAFPIPEALKDDVRFVITANQHEYGVYYEVEVKYRHTNSEAVDYAFNVEANTPANWDEEAQKELATLKASRASRAASEQRASAAQ